MYILMDIGCLECMVPTEVAALFVSKFAADAVCAALNDQRREARESDHEFEVFYILAAMTGPRVLIEEPYRTLIDACGVAYQEL